MAETKTNIPVEIKMGNAGTNDANLPAFKEGSIIFTKDTKKIYIDPVGETERIAVGGTDVDLSGKQDVFSVVEGKKVEDNVTIVLKDFEYFDKTLKEFIKASKSTDSVQIQLPKDAKNMLGGIKQIHNGEIGKSTVEVVFGNGTISLIGAAGRRVDISNAGKLTATEIVAGKLSSYTDTLLIDRAGTGAPIRIAGVADGAGQNEAVNKKQLDTKQDKITKDTELSVKKLLVAQTIDVPLLHLGGDNGHSIYSPGDYISLASNTGDALLRGLKTPVQSNDAANKKYVDDNSGAGKKFGTSEVFNDYENNKTYLYDGVRVTNVTSTTNSSTFTLESVAGLVAGGTFKVYTDVFHLLMNDTFTIATVDSVNKTITTTTKYSHPTENLYIVNSTATDTVSLFAYCAHAEGNETTATGVSSHAEGNYSKAIGVGSHAEGFSSKAAGDYSHAEGASNTASGNSSHAEGDISIASGEDSHAEGYQTTASGSHSHAQNYRTTAGYDNQTTMGMYNINKSTTLLEVGNGSTEANSNAFEVYRDGHAEVQTMGTTDNSVVIKSELDTKQAKFAEYTSTRPSEEAPASASTNILVLNEGMEFYLRDRATNPLVEFKVDNAGALQGTTNNLSLTSKNTFDLKSNILTFSNDNDNIFQVVMDNSKKVVYYGLKGGDDNGSLYLTNTSRTAQQGATLQGNVSSDSRTTALVVNESNTKLLSWKQGTTTNNAPLLGVSTPVEAADTSKGITANDLDYQAANKKYVDDIKTELLKAITHPYTYDETTKELTLIL